MENSPQAVEVWFPGCHSDVGGGYKEADLSYAPLNWMVRLSTNYGLLVDQTKIPSEPYFDSAMPVVHDETQKFGWRIIGFCTFDRYFNREVSTTDVVPWGWNHSLKKRLINEGVDPATLPSEEELQFIRTYSRREFALDQTTMRQYLRNK